MKIISIDVGIKNLAICALDILPTSHSILKWKIINCIQVHTSPCCVFRRGKRCNHAAVNSVMTDSDQELGYCTLKTCQREMRSSYGPKKIKKIKKINCNKISLDILGVEIYKHLALLGNLDEYEHIVIENQPVLKNPRMKSVQMLIYSFFLFQSIENNYSYVIKLFSARNKLNIYDGPEIKSDIKNKYALRKYLSVEYTKYFLAKYNNEYLDFFTISRKKDDLADSYLQGLTFYKRLTR